MFKKFFIFTIIFLNYKIMFSYSNSINHILPKNWYKEEIANLKKENVTSITIENQNIDKSRLKTYWEIDKKGLFAYIDDTDVFISCPENDTISTGTDASNLFSFFTLKKFDDYETGDDNEPIYGVKSNSEKEKDSENNNSIYISNLEAIYNLSFIDVSKTKNFNCFFMGLSKITQIDLSNFQTKSATTFSEMFKGLEMLKEIDLEFLDTKNVYDMSFMFSGCENLTSIDINHFDTRNLKNMNSMFLGCKNIEKIYIDKINTKKVNNTSQMFKDCIKIKNLNIDKLDFSGIIDCSFMFFNCENLESLNLNNFNLTGKTYCHYMLSECKNLKKITISNAIAKKIDETRIKGKWKNNITLIVYDFDAYPLKKFPIQGTYFNIKFLQ